MDGSEELAELRDADIRSTLLADIHSRHANDSSLLVTQELALARGRHRADVVVVNGVLTGFEIKSDLDSLRRLPGQVTAYSGVMDFVTVVTGPKWLCKVACTITSWRPPQENPTPNAQALLDLLWREDLVTLLEKRGAARGFRGANCSSLWQKILTLYTVQELRPEIRCALRQHHNRARL